MTADVEARLGADGPIDARALFAEPVAIVQRTLARRIAQGRGRDESRIGLEKIEALALRLRDAFGKQTRVQRQRRRRVRPPQREGMPELRAGAAEEGRKPQPIANSGAFADAPWRSPYANFRVLPGAAGRIIG